MECKFKSTKLGRTLTFTRHEGSAIFVDIRGEAGHGKQIFKGGRFNGIPIEYDGKDEEKFRFICRIWLNYYLKGVS